MAVNKREMGVVVIIVLALVAGIELLVNLDFTIRTFNWLRANTKREYWLAIVAGIGIILTGGVGGVFGACYRRKCHLEPYFQEWWDMVVFGGAGAASAFAVIVVCKGLGLVFGDPSSFYLAFKLYGLTFVSGFFAMRLLPCFGNMLEKKMADLTKQVFDSDKKHEAVERELKMSMRYASVLSKAQIALSRGNNNFDLKEAVKHVRGAISEHPEDRTLNIDCGLLYRALGDYDKAIDSLRAYIRLMKSRYAISDMTEEQKEAVAAATFNISCYLCKHFIIDKTSFTHFSYIIC